LIVSRPQSGYYVNYKPTLLSVPSTSQPTSRIEMVHEEEIISKVYSSISNKEITRFSLGVPENELLPIAKLNKELTHAMRSLSGGGTEYEEIQGNLKLRNDIARLTYTWNGNIAGNEIVTTSGVMNAISFGLMALTQKGDAIAVESPVYFGILQLAKTLGLEVIELPTHPVTGIEVGALKRVSRPKKSEHNY